MLKVGHVRENFFSEKGFTGDIERKGKLIH